MGSNFSSTYDESVQDSAQTINQQYTGTCNVQCQNINSGSSITCLNCNIGGNVEVEQSCAANGNCLFNTNQQATADTIFKATQVAANTPQSIWEKLIPGIDVSSATTLSRQNIVEDINESVSQACSISSVNQLENTNVFLANTNVGGNILIDQSGQTQGSCALNSMMSANAYASGTVNNCSATGKKASKTCSGKGGKKIGSTIVWFIVGIALVVIFFIIAKVIGSRKKKGAATPQCAPGTGITTAQGTNIPCVTVATPSKRGASGRRASPTTVPSISSSMMMGANVNPMYNAPQYAAAMPQLPVIVGSMNDTPIRV